MSRLGSLSARIYGLAALTAAIALLLGSLILQSSSRSQEAFGWVSHTQEVLITLDALEASLRRAESRARGFMINREETYLVGLDADLLEAGALGTRLTKLVADNPLQEGRAVQLAEVAADKGRATAEIVQRTRTDTFNAVPDFRERMRGRELMTAVAQQVNTMRAEERRLLLVRTAAAATAAAQVRALLLYGSPIIALLIGSVAWLVRTSISRPLANLLDVVTRFGGGDRTARAAVNVRSAEFRRLALAYNDMADNLVAMIAQQEMRELSVQLLSEMSHRLQTVQNDGELSEVLDCFIPQVLPDVAGALYVHNHSRNMLIRISSWGNAQASPEMFPPADCWGLRRGQVHVVEKPGADLVCPHAAAVPAERRCNPVLAGGEVLGLLYIEGHVADEYRLRLDLLVENVALALVNENLRSRLREQSIRDPLTKLFNRRYLEEALALETARAERSAPPLSIVMCDIDHFKRFNDRHGHEAGDVLLAAVAGLIEGHFRQGDIVCRYGGEEFTVIAPGAPVALIQKRVEALRLAVGKLTVDHQVTSSVR